MKKKLMTIFLLGVIAVEKVLAQGQGVSKVNSAFKAETQNLKTFFDTGVNTVYVVCGIAGTIGVVQLYNKFIKGDNEAGRYAGAWLGGAIVVAVAVSILRAVFIS